MYFISFVFAVIVWLLFGVAGMVIFLKLDKVKQFGSNRIDCESCRLLLFLGPIGIIVVLVNAAFESKCFQKVINFFL